MNWVGIAGVWLAGIGLLATELFVPGVVVGTLGGIAVIASVAMTFIYYGPIAGVVVGAGSLGVGVGIVKVGISRLAHKHELTDGEGYTGTDDRSELVGMQGVAATQLRPGGIARVGGKRVDVVTRGEMLEKGVALEVVAVEGNKIVVKEAVPEAA
ncbi:hypothetical protein OAX78_01735 [Planctomycetota bacterium]|nr:hypothetical protein [Planctomycetota bacterium]